MPLHLTWECCKCKSSGAQSLWSISRNHKYNYYRYVCSHFDVDIDTVSSCGFLGIGWENYITVEVKYKKYNYTRRVFRETFNKHFMEHEDYVEFDNVVFHARVSDYSGRYPTCGYNRQREIEYNERMEQQRREQEEKKRQYERNVKSQIEKLFQFLNDKKKEEQKEEEKKEHRCVSKKRNRLYTRQKINHINFDNIFEQMKEKKIAKSA